MGNTLDSSYQDTSKSTENILQKLQIYDEVVTQQFGSIKIYRISEKISRQMSILVDKSRQRFQDRMARYKGFKDHKNIVTIESIGLVETNEMCIKKIYLDIYARYYNFSLDMALDIKRQKQIMFREGDLFYILNCLISIAKETNQHFKDQYSGWFTLKNVFITPEGLIKVYIFPLREEALNNHVERSSHKYSRSYLDNQELIINDSPKRTQDQPIYIPNSPPKMNKKSRKNDIKQIGLLMYRLILTEKQSQDKNIQNEPFEMIQQKLDQFLSEEGLHKKLKELTLLLIKKYEELSINEIQALYESYRNDQFQEQRIYATNSIKLQEGLKLKKSNTNSNRSIHENLRASKAINITIGSKDRKSFIKK